MDVKFPQALIDEYIPSNGLMYHRNFKESDGRHNEIINRFQLPNGSIYSEYGNIGTTCGFLCQWLLFRLGLRNQRLLNRTTFKARKIDFANLSKMAIPGFAHHLRNKHGTLLPVPEQYIHFKTLFENGMNLKFCMEPEMTRLDGANFKIEKLKNIPYGTIGWIKGNDRIVHHKNAADTQQDTSHVFVIKSASLDSNILTLKTVEGGQSAPHNTGKPDVVHKPRKFTVVGNQIKTFDGDDRNLWGILRLDNLEFEGAPPVDTLWFPELLLYNPVLARLYYSVENISSISIKA
jgi:hypothetical protein